MKRQPITTEVINSYQQSLFLIKANLKVNESSSELMQYVKKAETFLELFLKLPALPKSLDLLDLVEFFIETKHTELEHFVYDVSSLRYPVNNDTSTALTGRSKLLLNTITMLFHYRKRTVINNNYNDFEAYVEFKLTNRADIS